MGMAAAFDVESLGPRFGLLVRAIREERGLSQEGLAARAELNRSYMGEIERATSMPSLSTAAKLARALGLPLWQLIERCESNSHQEIERWLVAIDG